MSIRKDVDSGDYQWPEAFDNGLRLKDFLEDEVDEKYYISNEKTEKLLMQLKDKESRGPVPCLTPDRAEKRQNGRRFKEDSDPMFTLTGQDRHGVLQVGNIAEEKSWSNPQTGRIYSDIGCSPTINTMQGGQREPKVIIKEATIGNYRIRKLTPKECWRLMGFKDEDFNKAEAAGISNTQLYKQAGNSIVTTVIKGIAENFKEK